MVFYRSIVAAFFLLCCWSAAAEERFALLVGNSRYESATPLRNPENDIAVVAQSLEAVGFKTTRIANADAGALSDAVDRFIGDVAKAERPIVIFYFAGHGVQRNGTNYLLPVDAKVGDVESLEASSVDAEQVIERLSSLDSALSIVILDACRDDPFDQRDRSAVPLQKGLVEISQASGQLIAFSTAPGKTAADGDTGTSPYASAFAETVLVPGLTVRTVFDRVREKVRERTKGGQEPWESSAVYQDFYFVPQTADVEISEVEALLWDNAALLDSAETYQRYIDRFSNGRFAALAKQKIENINKDFAFRKKAETFPIFTASGNELNFCVENKELGRSEGFGQLLSLVRFENELIYIDFNIPAANVLCSTTDPRWEGMRVTAVSPDLSECYRLFQGEDGYVDVTCIAPDDETANWKATGGLTISQDGHAVSFSGLVANYYTYLFDEAEGQIEYAALGIQGLVRIRTTSVEGFFMSHVIEPVNPADLGLSWKYQNTLDAYRKGSELSGVEVLSLVELGAQTEAEYTKILRSLIASYWSSEGAVFGLVVKDEYRALVYLKPSDALVVAGVEELSMRFDGNAGDGRKLSGTVNVFAPGCDYVPYDVSGSVSADGHRIVLEGKAPKIDSSCSESGKKPEKLVFEYLGTTEPN